MYKYHFRNVLGTVINNPDGSICEAYEGFDSALALAYVLSANSDLAIYVCKNSGTVDQPAYTEVASVRACK